MKYYSAKLTALYLGQFWFLKVGNRMELLHLTILKCKFQSKES